MFKRLTTVVAGLGLVCALIGAPSAPAISFVILCIMYPPFQMSLFF